MGCLPGRRVLNWEALLGHDPFPVRLGQEGGVWYQQDSEKLRIKTMLRPLKGSSVDLFFFKGQESLVLKQLVCLSTHTRRGAPAV